ncbi:MAG: tetratricopeptide repeat protein [Candidatus Melainabacteria bacterium]
MALPGCARHSEAPPSGAGAVISVQQHLDMAKKLIKQGNYDEAYIHLSNALQMSPYDPTVYQNLGWMYLYNDEPDRVKAELDKLKKLAPDDPETHYLAGALLARLEQHEDALEEYEAARKAMPDNAESAPHLAFDTATSQSALNRHEEALKTLQTGLKRVPEKDASQQTNFWYAICSEQYKLKQFRAALESCSKAMAVSPSDEEKQRIQDLIENLKLLEIIETDQ